MARPASGAAHIDEAKELLRTAKTADELRQAQAVLLPLTLGFSLQQTAAAIGRSVGATCSMRTRFLAVREGRGAAARSKRDLRNRASLTLEEEAQVLDKVFSGAAEGQVLVVPHLKPSIDQQLGKTLSLSSIYRMLARHGWRKLAPDTAHPQGDAQTREDWKKTLHSAGSSPIQRPKSGTVRIDVSGRGAFRTHQRLSSLLVPPPCAPTGSENDLAPVHLRIGCRQSARWTIRHADLAKG